LLYSWGLWVIYSGRKYSRFSHSILAMPHVKKENFLFHMKKVKQGILWLELVGGHRDARNC